MRNLRAILRDNKDLILSTEFLSEKTAGSFSQFRARLLLINGDTLNISEVRERGIMVKYSYYWMNKRNAMVIGWDNALHYPGLTGFPHHKHVGAKGTVKPSSEMSLEMVLRAIRHRIRDKAEKTDNENTQ